MAGAPVRPQRIQDTRLACFSARILRFDHMNASLSRCVEDADFFLCVRVTSSAAASRPMRRLPAIPFLLGGTLLVAEAAFSGDLAFARAVFSFVQPGRRPS